MNFRCNELGAMQREVMRTQLQNMLGDDPPAVLFAGHVAEEWQIYAGEAFPPSVVRYIISRAIQHAFQDGGVSNIECSFNYQDGPALEQSTTLFLAYCAYYAVRAANGRFGKSERDILHVSYERCFDAPCLRLWDEHGELFGACTLTNKDRISLHRLAKRVVLRDGGISILKLKGRVGEIRIFASTKAFSLQHASQGAAKPSSA